MTFHANSQPSKRHPMLVLMVVTVSVRFVFSGSSTCQTETSVVRVFVSSSVSCVGQWRGAEKFRCRPSHQEISHIAVCDGVVDCKNGLDELNETCGE